MNYKSYSNLRDDIVRFLPTIVNQNFDLIVGLPRSGMVPAYIIAQYLNIHVTDLTSLILNTKLKNGSTRKVSSNIEFPQDAMKILLVDDSIASGKSLHSDLASIPEFLLEKITTCAIYTDMAVRKDVDITFVTLPFPRFFEWNIFHRDFVTHSCFDIDGVLCVDPTEDENDDGQRYIEFLRSVKPLFIPTYNIDLIVTSRLEKYRLETEEWLNKNGVQYNRLAMLDLPTKEERIKLGAHGVHKGKIYKNSDSILFYESDYQQSVEIANLSQKVVFTSKQILLFTLDHISHQMLVSIEK